MGNLTIQELVDLYGDDLVIFRNPDYESAIIGVTYDNRVVYDYDKMVADLMATDGMSLEEAMEFIDYNTIRALSYFESAPVIIYNHTIKHGYWIPRKYENLGYYTYCCSECRQISDIKHNYCPKCGTTMDQES